MPRVENGRRPAGYYFRARANERQLSMLSDEQFEELGVVNQIRQLVRAWLMIEQDRVKYAAARRWCEAVNNWGRWGAGCSITAAGRAACEPCWLSMGSSAAPQRSWVYQHSTLNCGACPASKPHLKQRFRRISQQTKHVRDIASIVLYQAEALDLAYIDGWVRTVNLADEWRTIQERIAEL